MAHILVVDDDAAIREVVVDILEMSDYRVKTASNGVDALKQIKQDAPIAVLLDLMMPLMDGRELLHRCRLDPQCAHLPIAIMSAAPDAAATASSLGVEGYLAKPFELDAVLALVERLATMSVGGGRIGG